MPATYEWQKLILLDKYYGACALLRQDSHTKKIKVYRLANRVADNCNSINKKDLGYEGKVYESEIFNQGPDT
jgi:hypothetical protein